MNAPAFAPYAQRVVALVDAAFVPVERGAMKESAHRLYRRDWRWTRWAAIVALIDRGVTLYRISQLFDCDVAVARTAMRRAVELAGDPRFATIRARVEAA